MRCVIVGDEKVGKTSLLEVYQRNSFHLAEKDRSEVCKMVKREWKIENGIMKEMEFVDTHFSHAVFRTNDNSYRAMRNTDVFVICFSVTSRFSFENIELKWVPMIHHYCPDAPFLLVGTKIDKKDTSWEVSHEEGIALGRNYTVPYLECSSATLKGINVIFEEAFHIALRNDKKTCNIM